MTLHFVVFKVRKLLNGLIERDRKFPGRIDIPEKHIRDGCSAHLTRVPRLNDRIAAFRLRHEAHGASGEIHEHDFLSCLMQGFQESALHVGKFDVGLVAPCESGHVDRHFFPFETRGDSTRKDHDVDALELGEQGVYIQFGFETELEGLLPLDIILDVIHPDGILLGDFIQFLFG